MLYMETMKKERGADWVRVPFRGGGEAVNAMMSGTTPIALLGEANVIGHIQAGRMTPIAMVNNIKSPNFPNVPTLAETGYKGAVSESWYGLFVPPGTPKPIIDKVMRDVAKIVSESGIHPAASDAAQPGSGAQQVAGRVRRADQARPRRGRAGGEGGGAGAAVGRSRPLSSPRKRGTQYPRRQLVITGSSAFADDDSCCLAAFCYATSSKISASRSGMSTITSWPHGAS